MFVRFQKNATAAIVPVDLLSEEDEAAPTEEVSICPWFANAYAFTFIGNALFRFSGKPDVLLKPDIFLACP